MKKTATQVLEDQIMERAAREVAEDIDFGVLSDLLVEIGWTKITTSWDIMTLEEMYDLKEWCKTNLKGQRKGRGKTWLFELEKDASIFALRWA